MKLDILAFGAHRDDVEITIGGTLIKMIDLGYKVGVIDLTEGELGTYGSAKLRAKEANYAAKIMKLSIRDNLKLPDARIENNYPNKIKVVKLLRKYQPKIVILPYWKGRHPDHYRTPELVYESCFLSGLKKLKVPGLPHRPFKILYSLAYHNTRPSFIVDISDQFERKLAAIRAYKSQFIELDKNAEIPFSRTDIFESIRITNRYYGMMIQKTYGEPFLMKEMIEFEDISKILVKSI